MICEKCKQHVELGVGPSGKTYHALCLIEFQAEQINSLQAERDAAYAAGFEACREMAAKAAEEYEMSAPTYDIQRAANATASLIASDIRALQPQEKDAPND